MDLTILSEYGIDYKKGVARCMGDEGFYLELLRMFQRDTAFPRAQEALNAGEMRVLFACLHELKGTCGNIDLTVLYHAVCPLVELLRDENAPPRPEETALLFAGVQDAYRQVSAGIAQVLAAQ